jgi:hypothetical protein
MAWRQQQAFWQGLDAAGPDVLAALPESPPIARAASDRAAACRGCWPVPPPWC